MNVLFVGDVHNHLYIFKDVQRLDKEHNFDKIIFLGDYVDDWNTTNVESLQTLKTVIDLKLSNPDKYIFCIGNHELSYLQFPCSGHQYENEEEVNKVLEDNIDLFDFYTEIKLGEDIFVCSHSGFTNNYICRILDVYGDWKTVMEQFNKDKLNSLPNFRYCSRYRGGNDYCSSCLWTDKNELIESAYFEKMLIPNQIVGHSPVQKVSNEKLKDNCNLFFIDTHSTYRDGTEYGDKSYLMYDEEFKIVY